MDSHVSKGAVIDAIRLELDRIDHVPQWVYDRLEKAIKELPSAEEESFEWCTRCKEYDQEAHCCHRFTKAIRQAVAEMKLVHCHECQYSEFDFIYHDWYCHYNGKAEIVQREHFCGYADRREDG